MTSDALGQLISEMMEQVLDLLTAELTMGPLKRWAVSPTKFNSDKSMNIRGVETSASTASGRQAPSNACGHKYCLHFSLAQCVLCAHADNSASISGMTQQEAAPLELAGTSRTVYDEFCDGLCW